MRPLTAFSYQGQRVALRICSLLTLLVLMFFCSCISDEPAQEGNLVVGDPLPTFHVTMNDGSTVCTADLLGGVSVIVFFSVECGDCRTELPEVQRLWDLHPGVPVVLIARENTEEQISSFWQQERFTMIYSPQSDRKVYSLFASSRIPRIYISDAQGVIRFSHADDAMPSAEQMADEIKTLNMKD